MSSDNSDNSDNTPPEIRSAAQNASTELLPQKSRARYEAQYNVFVNWCEEKGVKSFSENVLLAYFTDLVNKNKKSLWAIYSMLKSCIMLNKNIDISKYGKLVTYLKRKTEYYTPKKSKILDEENFEAFLSQASDYNFLLMKVVLIIGVSGALRREELTNMVLKDLEQKDDIFIITIQIRSKITKVPDRVFLRYEKGKCCAVPVGINSIGAIPRKIAEFLKLEDPSQYTGHCFRRTSVTWLANRGGDLLTIKRHGGWKSGKVAEGYVAESLKRKIDVAHMMTEPGPSTSTEPSTSTGPSASKRPTFEVNMSSFNNPNVEILPY